MLLIPTVHAWIIDLPTYKSIEKFIEMDIEESPNCVKGRVTILNGKDGDAVSLESYCGNKLPATIQSSTETVVIKFISDGAINNKRFKSEVKVSPWPCSKGQLAM